MNANTPHPRTRQRLSNVARLLGALSATAAFGLSQTHSSGDSDMHTRAYNRAQSELFGFLPKDGLVLNLDADEIKGIKDGESLAGGWKSKYGSPIIATSDTPPIYNDESELGYPSVSFNGVDQYLVADLPKSNDSTIFMVFANRREALLNNYSDTLISTNAEEAGPSIASSRKIAAPETPPIQVIQFGWGANDFSKPAYQNQVGADEIIQFNGVNSKGGSFGSSGTLVNMLPHNPPGVIAQLHTKDESLFLTSRAVSSSVASRTGTVSSGKQLGINAPGAAANFQQSAATSWTFDFDKPVVVSQILFNGFDVPADNAQITIDGITYDANAANTSETASWSGLPNLHLYEFETPVVLGANEAITIAAAGSTKPPANNKWGLAAVVVGYQPPAPAPETPDYPGWVAAPASQGTSHFWANGRDTLHAGTDLIPGRFHVGTAQYQGHAPFSQIILGKDNSEFGQNDVRQILVYDRILCEDERLEVLAYLGAKYDLDVISKPLDHPVERFNHVLGTQQIGEQYSFGENGTQVLDAARAIYRQGSRTLKISLSSNFAAQNGVPANPAISSLTELTRDEPNIKAALDIPFTDILCWTASFSIPKWQNEITPTGLSESAQTAIKAEIKEFVLYLLDTYKDENKTFYLGNWEGDWMLNGQTYQPEDIPAERIQAMIDWANCRQQAVDEAKAEYAAANSGAPSKAQVYFYLELNKVDWAREGRPCIANNVIPAMPKLDMISISSYTVHKDNGSPADQGRMNSDLDLIQSLLDAKPDPSIEGSRLIIGEYGWQYNPATYNNSLEEFAQRHMTSAKSYFAWPGGAPRFILQWQFFNEEERPIGPKEMAQISNENELRPLYYMHENFYREMKRWVDESYLWERRLPTTEEYEAKAIETLENLDLGEYLPVL